MSAPERIGAVAARYLTRLRTRQETHMTIDQAGTDEDFLLRTLDGPHPGTRVVTWTWPLPDVIAADGGQYRKTGESALPPQPRGSHVIRGAEYRWEPAA